MAKVTKINANFVSHGEATYVLGTKNEIEVIAGIVEITGNNCMAIIKGKAKVFTHESYNAIFAKAPGAIAITHNKYSEAIAVVEKAIAESHADGAKAIASCNGAKARAYVRGAIAEAVVGKAIAEAMVVGAVANAKVLGAVAENNFKIPGLSKELLADPVFAGITKLQKDLITTSVHFGREEVGIMVKTYYQLQEARKRTGNQLLELYTNEKPSNAIQFLDKMNMINEKFVKSALDSYTAEDVVGQWLRSHHGIGPVIAAGLMAHIDITKAPTAGTIWAYAGYIPGLVWQGTEGAAKMIKKYKEVCNDDIEVMLSCCKEAKRHFRNFESFCQRKNLPVDLDQFGKWLSMPPWNADLKRLCYIIGQCFMKNSNHPDCYYGHIYKQYKTDYTVKNANGGYVDRAAEDVKNSKYGKTTESYKSVMAGKLPKAQIDAMARRKCVSLFLAHLHDFWYTNHFGKRPPKPYAIEFGGHAHVIEPHIPNKPSKDDSGDDISWRPNGDEESDDVEAK
jgi:hypothetical protein